MQYTKVETAMANAHLKAYSTSLIITSKKILLHIHLNVGRN